VEKEIDMEYHKILTIFKRDPATKHRTLLMGEWACPEFEYLAECEWIYTEKIDGTNMRVYWDGTRFRYAGRTDNAQIPTFLLDKMAERFEAHKKTLEEIAPDGIVLYGEGYGAKIQKGGGNYIPGGVDFILFDVRCGDWWLKREDVEDVATKLGLRIVPIIGTGPLKGAIRYAEEGFASRIAQVVGTKAEGLVMRPDVELFGRNGKRVIAKIKSKDFPK